MILAEDDDRGSHTVGNAFCREYTNRYGMDGMLVLQDPGYAETDSLVTYLPTQVVVDENFEIVKKGSGWGWMDGRTYEQFFDDLLGK